MGLALHDGRPATAGQERELNQRLVEHLLGRDPALRRGAWEEALDRGLLDDVGQVAVLLVSRGPEEGGGAPDN